MAVYVDALAQRYGWTWDYIESLPNRKVDALMTVIAEDQKRQKRERERAKVKSQGRRSKW